MWRAGPSPACLDAGLAVPPDLRQALEAGKQVYLRAPTARDEAEIIQRSLASRAFHRNWVAPPKDHQAFLEWIGRMKEPSTRHFLVCRVDDGSIVGVFSLNQIVRRLFQNAYMGYYAFRPYAGMGYMTEGLQLVLRQVFTSLNLHRVEANIQPTNAASIALVKRAGFRLEGYSPKYLKISGRWRDHERWAMLIDDWKATRRRGG